MTVWKDKVIIITGGSSGIGLAIAKLFAMEGARLYLLARNPANLEQAAKTLRSLNEHTSVKTIPVNISDPELVYAAIDEIGRSEGQIDLLVNNAGIIRCGRFDEITREEAEECLRTNYLGSHFATRAAWKYLAIAGGRVALVSSVAGYIGLIGYSAYAPTKFAMAGLAECLRMEGKFNGINVSIIYPGDTNTPQLEYEHLHGLAETREINKSVKVKNPEDVAHIFKRGIEKNRFDIYCDFDSRFYRILKTVLPGVFYKAIDDTARKGHNKRA
jgi:3-dehydrosphinganine reductase